MKTEPTIRSKDDVKSLVYKPRLRDWRARLQDRILVMANVPFSYEDGNDCVKWTAGNVEAVLGINPIAGFPGWASEAEAKEVLKLLGVRSHVSLMNKMFRAISPNAAIAGDIAVFQDQSLGTFQGDLVYRPRGALSPREFVVKAFQVGDGDR